MHHCERCHKPATVHMTEIAGGKPHEVHLCDACAQAAGYVQQHVSIDKLLSQYLEKHVPGADLAATRCPDCGMSWQEFKDTGLLGCPKDYELFINQLGGVIERAQGGGNHHTGKAIQAHEAKAKKAKDDPVKLRQAELNRLRKELARAVQAESYEQAARLRDQIRALESA